MDRPRDTKTSLVGDELAGQRVETHHCDETAR
jgi:hypothetical protein